MAWRGRLPQSPRQSRGWGALVALALAVWMLSLTADPLPLWGLPLAVLLVGLPPRRPSQLGLAALAVAIALMGAPGDSIWLLGRGWALLLGAWFLIMLLVLPTGGHMLRALAATFASAVTATALLLLRPGSLGGIDYAIAARLQGTVRDQLTIWKGAGAKLPPEFVDTMYRMPDMGAFLAPALTGLASVAALGLAWGIYRRVLVPDRAPLSPLRDFRFRDELVWVVIAGILLVVVPGIGPGALRAGSNLLTFMGALYALRGVAVLVALTGGAVGIGGAVLAVLAALPVLPIATAATALVGLTDTWLDLRARIAPAGQGK